jgi:hypothetical protein
MLVRCSDGFWVCWPGVIPAPFEAFQATCPTHRFSLEDGADFRLFNCGGPDLATDVSEAMTCQRCGRFDRCVGVQENEGGICGCERLCQLGPVVGRPYTCG